MRRFLAPLVLLAVVGCSQAGPAAPRAAALAAFEASKAGCTLATGVPMYRVFRGVKRADVAPAAFLKDLSARFIPAAPATHGGKGLVAYLPAVPPADAPAGTPAEIAIVVYASEAVYQERRNSPEGKAYGDMHWELFDRPATKSDTAVGWTKNGPALKANVPVDMFEAATDWQCGHGVVYVGRRKADVPADAFLGRLSAHVAHTKAAFGPLGLRGYVVVATEDQEIAWMNWSSKVAADKALGSVAGRSVREESAALMANVMWSDAGAFHGEIRAGEAVNVKFRK
jgi:hypothetical protein